MLRDLACFVCWFSLRVLVFAAIFLIAPMLGIFGRPLVTSQRLPLLLLGTLIFGGSGFAASFVEASLILQIFAYVAICFAICAVASFVTTLVAMPWFPSRHNHVVLRRTFY